MFESALLSLVALALLSMGQAVRRDYKPSDNDLLSSLDLPKPVPGADRMPSDPLQADHHSELLEEPNEEELNEESSEHGQTHTRLHEVLDTRLHEVLDAKYSKLAYDQPLPVVDWVQARPLPTATARGWGKKDDKDAEMENMKTAIKGLMTIVKGMKAELEEVEDMKTSVKEMKAELEERGTRDVPTIIKCAYKQFWRATGGKTMTYDRFITDFNNADRPNGGDGRLDLDTGIFTCLSAGHYIISHSGVSHHHPNGRVDISVYHNGRYLPEGRWEEYYEGSKPTTTQGARTLILYLAVGDTIQVRGADRHDCNAGCSVNHFTLCIYLPEAH